MFNRLYRISNSYLTGLPAHGNCGYKNLKKGVFSF